MPATVVASEKENKKGLQGGHWRKARNLYKEVHARFGRFWVL